MSWRQAPPRGVPEFEMHDFSQWLELSSAEKFRIDGSGRLVRAAEDGRRGEPAMQGWRIPLARAMFKTPWGLVASGPGGCYRTTDGKNWEEMKLWREDETGAADFLHAYWMGRYYRFVQDGQATICADRKRIFGISILDSF